MVALRPSPSARKRLRFFVFAGLIASAGFSCWAQGNSQAAEYQVKAAFLYKFLSFVEWPPQVFARTDSPLVIGVLGADPLADELAVVVAERTAHGRPVEARKIQPGESIAGLHMLFVGRSNSALVGRLLDSTKGRQPLLIVTESDEAFADGSAINFVVVDNKIRFDVALRSAEQSHLKISSRLLAVARRVLPGAS